MITETRAVGNGSVSEPLTIALTAPFVQSGTFSRPSFADVYELELAFVWRNLRRLGVAEAGLRDATQDVFVVVHRRLAEFEGRAPLRSWLYSIVARVARDHKRRARRKDLTQVHEPDELVDENGPSPQREAERSEDVRLLIELLEALDDDKREAFILADLEEMSAPEIAVCLEVNLNTVYSRIRAARQQLRQELLARRRSEP